MRTRHLIACGLAALALTAAGCGDDDGKDKATAASGDQTTDTQQAPAAQKGKPKVEVPDGAPPKKLVTEDIEQGSGKTAKSGDEVTVNYVGVSYSTKKEFDASYGKQPFTFPLGAGQVIPGWDQGVAGMKVGGRRKLVIPPDLGYGAAGSPPVIKPNETLVFVVDLIDVK
jgi:peptidylprolyl isomerase